MFRTTDSTHLYKGYFIEVSQIHFTVTSQIFRTLDFRTVDYRTLYF